MIRRPPRSTLFPTRRSSDLDTEVEPSKSTDPTSKGDSILGSKARKTGGKKSKSKSTRSEEHTSELQSPCNLVCRLLLEKKKEYNIKIHSMFNIYFISQYNS